MTSPTFAFATPPQLVRAPDKTITFTGAANFGAAGTNTTVYTCTGQVMVVYFPPAFCSADLTEAAPTAQISLGTTTTTNSIIVATNSTAIDVDEFWDTTGVPKKGAAGDLVEFGNVWNNPIILSENIVIAAITQNTTGGTLIFRGLHYIPLTAGATLS